MVRKLQGRKTLMQGTPEFGEAFETFIMHELTASRNYTKNFDLTFWRSTSGYETDFVIDDHTAIEVKAKAVITADDLKSLLAIADEHTFKKLIYVCLEQRRRKVGKIDIIPYAEFLQQLP